MLLIPLRLRLREYTPTAHTSDGGTDPHADFLTKHQTWFIVSLAGILGTVTIICAYALWRGPQRVFFPCCGRCRRSSPQDTEDSVECVENRLKRLEVGERGRKTTYLTDLKRQMEIETGRTAAGNENGSKEGLVRARIGVEGKTNKLRKSRRLPPKSPNKNDKIASSPTHGQFRNGARESGSGGYRETISSFGHPASMLITPSTGSGFGTGSRGVRETKRLSVVPEYEHRPEGFYNPNSNSRKTWGPSPLGGGPHPNLGKGYTGSPLSNQFPPNAHLHAHTQSLVVTNQSPSSDYYSPLQMPQPVRSPTSPNSNTGWAI